MSRLVWDATGEKKFETGVNHGVLYPLKPDGTYDIGVVWNGLTGVTMSPDGAEPTDLWADNIKYATMRSAETLGGTIEAYTYPVEFAKCNGEAIVTTGVVLGQQKRQAFGFSYRTEIGSDTSPVGNNYKIHIVYNATCSPSERAYETINDSPDAITFSWEFTTVGVNVTGYEPTSEITIEVGSLPEAKRTALINTLYGTDGTPGTNPTLPDPDTLLALITASTTT